MAHRQVMSLGQDVDRFAGIVGGANFGIAGAVPRHCPGHVEPGIAARVTEQAGRGFADLVCKLRGNLAALGVEDFGY